MSELPQKLGALASEAHTLQLEVERLRAEVANWSAKWDASEGERSHIAAAIRALPFTQDTRDGRRQAYMRERAACLVEGTEPPSEPEGEK